MTASCLSCHQSRPRGDGLVCAFHDNATVRGSYVCLSWSQQGGQGSFYGSSLVERRESQQEHLGDDRRGSHGVRVAFHDVERVALDEYHADEVSQSGSVVIPGLSLTVRLPDAETPPGLSATVALSADE